MNEEPQEKAKEVLPEGSVRSLAVRLTENEIWSLPHTWTHRQQLFRRRGESEASVHSLPPGPLCVAVSAWSSDHTRRNHGAHCHRSEKDWTTSASPRRHVGWSSTDRRPPTATTHAAASHEGRGMTFHLSFFERLANLSKSGTSAPSRQTSGRPVIGHQKVNHFLRSMPPIVTLEGTSLLAAHPCARTNVSS